MSRRKCSRGARRAAALSSTLALAVLSTQPLALGSQPLDLNTAKVVVVVQPEAKVEAAIVTGPAKGEEAQKAPAETKPAAEAKAAADAKPSAEAKAAAAEKPKSNLPPELEKKLDEYFEKLTEAKGKYWREQILKEIEEIAKATGLSEDGKKTLEKAGGEAVERSVKGWRVVLDKIWGEQMRLNIQPQQMTQFLNQMIPQVAEFAKQEFPGDYKRPNEEEVWLEAMKRALSPEQSEAWKKVTSARDAAKEKEATEIVNASMDRIRQQMSVPIMSKAAEIKVALQLPPERAKALDDLAKKATDEGVEATRKKTLRQVMLMADDLRLQQMKRGQIFFGWEEADLPLNQASWKDGLAKLLTDEERTRLITMKDVTKTRRARVFGEVMLAEMDEKLAFTAAQREKLRPIAERLVKGQPTFFPEDDGNSYRSYPLPAFYAAADKVTKEDKEELTKILDAIQWKRWQQVSAEGMKQQQARERGDSDANAPEKPSNLPPPDPEEYENAISDFLFQKVGDRRTQLLQPMTLKAEDLARVTGASPEVLGRLKSAARGSVELMLGSWKAQMEEIARQNLSSTSPLGVRRRLANLEDYYFNQRNNNEAKDLAIWDKAVQAELTPEQLASWKKETEARRENRLKAMTSAILIEMDSKAQLSKEQWDQLEPKITKIVDDYTPEITNYFSTNEGEVWYLQYYTKFVPCAGVPEAEMKTILAKDQWDRWTGCQEYSNAVNSWESIKQQHEQRVRRKQQ